MTEFALEGKKVWVAGRSGMVGSALVRRLEREDCEVIAAPAERLDLRDQSRTAAFMQDCKPDIVFVAAAKVGGILANSTYPAEFLYDNLVIEANVIHTASRIGVEKLVFLGSSCIYPRDCPQPIREEYLLTGPLEQTNEWYAVAKIAGIKLCQAYRRQYGLDFISAMPTNLYGPNDNFDLTSSHVLPALMRKADTAKATRAAEIVVWGSGKPRREFLHVDDCADALLFLCKHYSADQHVNVGCGEDLEIGQLARDICDVVGFDGPIVFDATKPDGTLRKVMSVEKLLALGWAPSTDLKTGLRSVYDWYRQSDLRSIAAA